MPAHLAAWQGNAPVLSMLLANGADPNRAGKQSCNAASRYVLVKSHYSFACLSPICCIECVGPAYQAMEMGNVTMFVMVLRICDVATLVPVAAQDRAGLDKGDGTREDESCIDRIKTEQT